MTPFNRRNLLRASALGTLYAGLRAASTGLPAWFLANPLKANAADMACTLANVDKLQFLVASTSSAGDPISCNVPGTYEADAIIHPAQAEFAATDFDFGTKKVKAAQIWSTLTDSVRSRTNFFHHITGGLVHGDHPKVMRFLGNSAGGEMWPSIYAKRLAPCLGTVQAEPVSVGAGGNALEQISFQGRTLAAITPTQLKQLLTGSMKDPVVALRKVRDKTLDDLNTLFKENGSSEQIAFIDALHNSQAQVRKLATDLADVFSAIADDGVGGQALAAAALVQAKVSPAIMVHIRFGGDNHNDSDLYDEWYDTTDHASNKSGVPGIQAVIDALDKQVPGKATFATMNVFGRDLAGTAKVAGRSGRDHFGNHSVMVMIGKNVAPGVTGGCTPLNAAYVASDIDSATGASKASGGDIPRADTHVAAAKTLGVALGLDAETLAPDFNDNGTIKYAKSAILG
ncbi:MAG TPA: hypothetical protein VER11_07290 [Polyangiaceae bacterium]|nr:hypothetical protein [Polyangiaceae bacterium]